jgi:hypothetical protein
VYRYAAVATSLGFLHVTALRDGARTTVMPRQRRNHGGEEVKGKQTEGGDLVVGAGAVVRATAGARVGPPWSEREAGFIISERQGMESGSVSGSEGGGAGGAERGGGERERGGEGGEGGIRVYYEPHCSYDAKSVAAAARLVGGRVDVAITPVRSVDVLGFALVNGGEAGLYK